MKKLIVFVLFVLPIICECQYSNYYDVDVNSNSRVSGNVNLNQNVNVSGYTTHTINTIDYGQLSLANAQREKTRLQALIYADEKSRQKALEIANDPLKAHEYGKKIIINYSYTNKGWRSLILTGFKSFKYIQIIPSKSLFQLVGQGRLENISPNGITTEIISKLPVHNYDGLYTDDLEEIKLLKAKRTKLMEYYQTHSKPIVSDYPTTGYNAALSKYQSKCDSLDNFVIPHLSVKSEAKALNIKEREKFLSFSGDSVFCHKKATVKRTVYGHPGFRSTIIWEDEYEICITDNYNAHFNGIEYAVKVRYKADKESQVTFKDLEGRRYYLSKYIDKNVASRYITNVVKCNPRTDFNIPKRKKYNNHLDYEEAHKKYFSDRLYNEVLHFMGF